MRVERSNDVERRAAIETRFRGRVSWLLLGAVVLTRVGQLDLAARGLAIGAVAAAFVWLNLGAVNVVRRARREKVPFVHWQPIAVALAIRAVSFAGVVSLVW